MFSSIATISSAINPNCDTGCFSTPLHRKAMTELTDMKFLGDENYRATMNQLMKSLIDEQRKGSSDFQSYAPKFYELMQSRVDPPLETFWVYSWLRCNCGNFKKIDALERVVAIKNLFRFISACSTFSGAAKNVVGVSPVLFELCAFVADELGGKDLSSKREKKILKEVVNLSEMILGYINVCFNSSNEEAELNGCIASFPDLARLWMSSNDDESGVLKSFLPLASDEVCRDVLSGGCNMKQLAGVVTAQAFLLKLFLLFLREIPQSQLEQEMRNWAVGSISALQNHYFFEVLVKMLLEPTLPLTYLSLSYDEVMLRKVLYDSLIPVEYYFLNFKSHTAERMKHLALTRLVMTYEVVEYYRQNGDHRRAASYTDAFARSKLCSQFKRWMKSQFVINDDAAQPNGSSPKAILKWLLSFENKGIIIFDDSMAGYRTRVADEITKDNIDELQNAEDSKNSKDDVFFIDKTGEDMDEEAEKQSESMSAAFMAAAHKMKDENKGSKRKGIKSKRSKPIKFIKYDVADNSHLNKEMPAANNDESDSDINAGNEKSDEDVSDIE